jgi:4-amino-4-deoxy-L-arabinose transferase-like glycosyltransferase
MRRDTRAGADARVASIILAGLAAGYFLLEWLPGILGRYGYFIDEFYYVACSNHLALGYVDHPPLSIFLLRLVRDLIGTTLPALRFVPALAGAGTILVIGLTARRMGAGLWGQTLAALAAMVAPVYQVTFGYYSMNALEVLMWASGFLILVEIERRDEPRLWLLFGILVGLGLENKHTFALMPAGLGVGLVLTGARRHLRSRWLWMGLGAAVALALPNLVWQVSNGWPSLEFYRNADMFKNVRTPPLEVILQQVLTMNPATMPVWVAGLVFFLAARRGQRYRHLGLIYVVLLVLVVIGQKSRPDRIAGAYTILLAGGGVALGETLKRGPLRWLKWALLALLVLSGAALAPVGVPVLPPEAMAKYTASLGVVPRIEKGEGKVSPLPQWYADRLGWQELVDDVGTAAELLSPAERRHAVIIAPSYGQAGAIEILGRGRGLPPVYATQNSYFHWGPPPDSLDVAIIVGPFSEQSVRRYFEEVQLALIHHCQWCTPWRDDVPIWIARKPRMAFREAWPQFKHYE